MSLHRLAQLTIGVPDPKPVVDYYSEFGLESDAAGGLETVDGGRQLVVVPADYRQLIEMVVGVDDDDDLEMVASRLTGAGHRSEMDGDRLVVTEPHTAVRVVLELSPRIANPLLTTRTVPPYNRPERMERRGARSPALTRSGPVRPRRLGHVVVTTKDMAATSSFFEELIGFKVSDYIGEVGVFLRCSTDHHNLLILSAPISYLHHTAWLVDDIDEVGRGATAMLESNPERHVWGLGRHHAGSNFFWYLKDPAGNYSEYYADLDYIPEDATWTPESHPGRFGLYHWGPPPPPSFLQPDDLTELSMQCAVRP
jgi:catechol 2,3-dioxygenase-like lactoylglutathione lyase family enzyme